MRWIDEVKPGRCTLSTFAPYPGCDIFLHPERYGYVMDYPGNWRLFWMLGYETTSAPFVGHTEAMTNEDLIKARSRLHQFMVERGYKSAPPEGWQPRGGDGLVDYHRLPDILQPPHHEDSYADVRQQNRVEWLVQNSTGSVLELGCAEGFILDRIGQPCSVGLDYDQDRVREAKRKYPHISFYVMDIRFGLPFPENYFDTVLAADVLEHMDFPDAVFVLREAIRVCRDRTLVTLPCANGDDYDEGLVHTPDHKWIPDLEKVSRLLHKAECSASTMVLEGGFVLIRVDKR